MNENEIDSRYVFQLTKKQTKMFEDWISSRPEKPIGAIGGRYVFSFCSTTIGVVVKVRDDGTGEELDLSCYEDW